MFLDKCQQCYNLVQAYLNDEAQHIKPGYTTSSELKLTTKLKIHQSLEILRQTLHDNLGEISISYNGGKDCLVMLILILATIYELNIKVDASFKLPSVYINSEVPFDEVTNFINYSNNYYNLNSTIIKDELKSGFKTYLDENPQITTIIVGIRRTDPYGSDLLFKQPTDHHWPKFMRIHPILDWHYTEIWDFIISCDLPYCELYDKGFTSLGGVNNTVVNPKLKSHDGYLPAYMLKDKADEYERLGRNVK